MIVIKSQHQCYMHSTPGDWDLVACHILYRRIEFMHFCAPNTMIGSMTPWTVGPTFGRFSNEENP